MATSQYVYKLCVYILRDVQLFCGQSSELGVTRRSAIVEAWMPTHVGSVQEKLTLAQTCSKCSPSVTITPYSFITDTGLTQS